MILWLLLSQIIAVAVATTVFYQTSTPPNSEYGLVGTIIDSSYNGQVVVVAADGSIYVSFDYGSDWVVGTSPAYGPYVDMALNQSGSFGILATSDSLLTSTDFGISWQTVFNAAPGNEWQTVDCSANGQFVIAGQSRGQLYLSNNSGVSWTEVNLTKNTDYSSVGMSSSGQHMIAVCDGTKLFVSHNFGMNWTTALTYTCLGQSTISANGSVIFLPNNCNANNLISFDYGESWLFSQPVGDWLAGDMTDSGQYIIASSQSGISQPFGNSQYSQVVLSTTSGSYWSVILTATSSAYQFQSTAISGTGNLLLVGSSINGQISYSTDLGISWLSATMPSSLGAANSVMSIATSTTGNVSFAVVSGYGVLMSVNYGVTFAASHLANLAWVSVACSGSGKYVLVTAIQSSNVIGLKAGYVYLSSNGGSTWSLLSAVEVGGTAAAAAMDQSGQYMMVATSTDPFASAVWISSDYGQNWQQSTAASSTEFWTSAAMDGNGGTMFIGASQSLFVSTDHGSSWQSQQLDYYDSISFITVSQNASFRAFGGSGSDLVIYTDGTWQDASTTSISGVSMATENPALMVSLASGGTAVAVSSTYGAYWTQAELTPDDYYGILYVASDSSGKYMLCSTNGGGLIYSTNPSSVSAMPSASPTAAPTHPTASPTRQPTHPTAHPTAYPTSTSLTMYLTQCPQGQIEGPVAATPSGSFIINGYGLSFYVSYNYGSDWSTIENRYTPQGPFQSIAVNGTGELIVVSSTTNVYASVNGGSTWVTNLTAPENSYWLKVYCSTNGKYIIAMPYFGALYISTDYGTSWKAEGPPSSFYTSAAVNSDGQYMLACIDDSPTYLSTDFGKTWNVVSSLPNCLDFATISSSGAYMAGVMCYSLDIWQSSDYGVTWAMTTLDVRTDDAFGDAMNIIAYTFAADVPSTQVGISDYGKLYFSFDYGVSWTEASIYQTDDYVSGMYWASVLASSDGTKILATSNFDYNLYSTYQEASVALPTPIPTEFPVPTKKPISSSPTTMVPTVAPSPTSVTTNSPTAAPSASAASLFPTANPTISNSSHPASNGSPSQTSSAVVYGAVFGGIGGLAIIGGAIYYFVAVTAAAKASAAAAASAATGPSAMTVNSPFADTINSAL